MTSRQSVPKPDVERWLDGELAIRKNLSRQDLKGNLAAVASGVMTSVALYLERGDLVTNLTFVSATTAADTPTHWWFALYSNATTPALIAQTADQTTGAWAANTVKTLALSSPHRVTATGIYYAAVMVAADVAVPTLVGATALHNATISDPIITGQKVLAQTSGSSLTDTAPATITTTTTVVTVPLVIAS